MKYEVYCLYPMLQATFDTEEEASLYMREQASEYGCVPWQPGKQRSSLELHDAMVNSGIYTMYTLYTTEEDNTNE